jgi:hypothetical protein
MVHQVLVDIILDRIQFSVSRIAHFAADTGIGMSKINIYVN